MLLYVIWVRLQRARLHLPLPHCLFPSTPPCPVADELVAALYLGVVGGLPIGTLNFIFEMKF
jgi:hypothetical protein